MLHRRHIATLLLLTFVVGGVLAPASHHLYMAAGEAYGPWRQAHTTHHTHHEASSETAPAVAPEHPSHAPCEYAALFATLLLAPHAPVIFQAPASVGATLPLLSASRYLVIREALPISERGPPAA
ncbi:MAG: hypothetical protein D6746_17615 [Bacteroidetes bacterium]|nr:MAG: hypothetical protein D6746_17615 [Bacteroidota bacterium]